MAQTTYPTDLRAPVPGMPQGDGVDINCVNHATALEAGVGVVLDTSATVGQERRVKKPDTNTESIYGVVLWQGNVDNQALLLQDIWPEDSLVPVRRQGRVWCLAEEAINPTDAVWMRHTDPLTPATDKLGAFRTDTDGGDADLVTGMRVIVGAAAAGGVFLAELDFPTSG